jgi:hypothetical protein
MTEDDSNPYNKEEKRMRKCFIGDGEEKRKNGG